MRTATGAALGTAILLFATCGGEGGAGAPGAPSSGLVALPDIRPPLHARNITPPPSPPAPTAPTAPEVPHYLLDDSLKLNEIQLKGAHNAYHIRPEGPSDPAWAYDLPPLGDQMAQYGVRAFELDLHYYGGQFLVFHLPEWDERSTCYTLQDCLAAIRTWSEAHPGHAPMVIFYELKDESDPVKVADHLDELEQVLVDNWPRQNIFTPDDLDGKYPDPQSALHAHGWPTLGQLRGKVIMALHEFGLARHRYTYGSNGLWGRRMFVEAVDGSNRLAAILALDDADMLEGTIKHYVATGFLVRTRADDLPTFGGNRWIKSAAAFRSGAQFVLTDYPQPWYLPDYDSSLPGGTPGRCNPVTGPTGCLSGDVEDPALLTKAP
jgi:hypothetical protein